MPQTAAEWHAALNHLPPALFVASVIFDLLGSALKRDSLKTAGFWTLIGGVLGAAAAVTSGLIAEDRIEHGEAVHQMMDRHKTWAISVSVTFALLAAWRIWRRGVLGPQEQPTYLFAASLAALGILWTAHLGGTMVFRHAAGVPTAALQEELKDRAEVHHHEEGEEREVGEAHEHGAPDSAVAKPDTGHTHAPGTPPHKHD
jgi:uncharacterized membrane protein